MFVISAYNSLNIELTVFDGVQWQTKQVTDYTYVYFSFLMSAVTFVIFIVILWDYIKKSNMAATHPVMMRKRG